MRSLLQEGTLLKPPHGRAFRYFDVEGLYGGDANIAPLNTGRAWAVHVGGAEGLFSMPAQLGDWISITLSGVWAAASAPMFSSLDYATQVASADYNWLSGGLADGVPGWLGPNQPVGSEAEVAFEAEQFYHLTDLAELAGGVVSLKLYAWHSAAGTRTLRGNGTLPLQAIIRNWGPSS